MQGLGEIQPTDIQNDVAVVGGEALAQLWVATQLEPLTADQHNLGVQSHEVVPR